jgi:hypothetical protein
MRFILCVALALTVHAAEVIDNATVVRLTTAGLSADLIVLKIDQSEGRFDTSADGLIALKGAGVADMVIKAMLLKAPAPPPPVATPIPAPAPVKTQTCAGVESYALGNNGWSWVPATVCVSSNEMSLDEQSFRFSDLKVQCVETPARLSVLGLNATTDATWRWSDGKEAFQIRGKGDDIRRLSEALVSAAPAVRHGSCGDLRALLKTR